MSLKQAVGYALSPERTLPAATGDLPRSETRRGSSTSLTAREREVASLVAQWLTNRRISKELSISERTVTTHVARSLKKLELGSRSKLAAWITAQEQSPKDPA
jgi:DNA-binding NarL/FixJ family response regulator